MLANRVDTLEKKNAIYQRIGPEKAESYFINLERFLNLKLSQTEFHKMCIQIIGRKNLNLHNDLIRSILHNARIPPKEARKADVKVGNCDKRSHLQSLCADTLPQPPRKCRSLLSRDRKTKERKSPLGPLGKSPSYTIEETVSRLQEQQSGAELPSFSGRQPLMVEDGEEVDQSAGTGRHLWTSVTAPLGVSLHSTSLSSCHCFNETCQSSGELPDTKALGRRLQEKLGKDGVGISLDGANLLNKSLDVYLKKIMSQCVGIAGKPVSGFNEISPGHYVETPREQQQNYLSLLDFRFAMESNPSVLGSDWPLQLEKICNYSFQ